MMEEGLMDHLSWMLARREARSDRRTMITPTQAKALRLVRDDEIWVVGDGPDYSRCYPQGKIHTNTFFSLCRRNFIEIDEEWCVYGSRLKLSDKGAEILIAYDGGGC